MTLQTKFIDFVHRTATGSRKVRNVFTPIGAVFFCLFVCAFVYAGLKIDRLLGIERAVPASISIIFSIPIFVLAIFLVGWSAHHFLKAKGTPVPVNPPPKLVTTGPYAHTRNPMLTGVFALLFGLAVLFGSISLFFVFTPLFIAINYWELKRIEEPELEKRLGSDYTAYRARTPMFLPNIKRKKREERQ